MRVCCWVVLLLVLDGSLASVQDANRLVAEQAADQAVPKELVEQVAALLNTDRLLQLGSDDTNPCIVGVYAGTLALLVRGIAQKQRLVRRVRSIDHFVGVVTVGALALSSVACVMDSHVFGRAGSLMALATLFVTIAINIPIPALKFVDQVPEEEHEERDVEDHKEVQSKLESTAEHESAHILSMVDSIQSQSVDAVVANLAPGRVKDYLGYLRAIATAVRPSIDDDACKASTAGVQGLHSLVKCCVAGGTLPPLPGGLDPIPTDLSGWDVGEPTRKLLGLLDTHRAAVGDFLEMEFAVLRVDTSELPLKRLILREVLGSVRKLERSGDVFSDKDLDDALKSDLADPTNLLLKLLVNWEEEGASTVEVAKKTGRQALKDLFPLQDDATLQESEKIPAALKVEEAVADVEGLFKQSMEALAAQRKRKAQLAQVAQRLVSAHRERQNQSVEAP